MQEFTSTTEEEKLHIRAKLDSLGKMIREGISGATQCLMENQDVLESYQRQAVDLEKSKELLDKESLTLDEAMMLSRISRLWKL